MHVGPPSVGNLGKFLERFVRSLDAGAADRYGERMADVNVTPDVVFAQARFNAFRPNRWVTVGMGTSEDIVRGAAAGLYGAVVSPMGDTPYRVRVHTPESETERAQAMADIAVTAAWGARLAR